MSDDSTLTTMSYERVHDIYGPGVFIAWILVGYSATIRLLPLDDPPRTDSITHDFIATLAYPIVVAGHLIVQARRYPGPRNEMWDTTDEQLLPFMGAFNASFDVLYFALGLNGLWMLMMAHHHWYEDRRQTRRIWLVTIASLWILVAFCFVPYAGFLGTFLGSVAVFLACLFLVGAPLFLCMWIVCFVAAIVGCYRTGAHLVARMRSFDRFAEEDFYPAFKLAVAAVGASAFAVSNWSVLALGVYLVPKSGHAWFDLGQAFSLTVGGINLGFAVRAAVKEVCGLEGGVGEYWGLVVGGVGGIKYFMM
ncbi:hypothetical protein K458DRAFT_395741 [Lentithecium fluviatile CBS 122367]|uniref:Uncharacterized protein n=1 Tax=Lentithecium fluviatile CBS 122367 TaxID=1168545 RepID=A0A6G1II94_9PLEO|nr:hypothetical protein K458DRAFT_395741 [Lentithecium fluviatile CBS 122367]